MVIDRLRERVQIAKGLKRKKDLTKEARKRALDCLGRFGQRVQDLSAADIRAVGTNALRAARDSEAFLADAEAELGHPIDVISGIEEARLVYIGVTNSVETEAERRLVLDIGGGSTECVLGDGDEIVLADSMHMGCVSWSERFFGSGKLSESRFKEAEIAAALELRPIRYRYRDQGWQVCFGSSGTVNAIAQICKESGYSDGDISYKCLQKVRKDMVSAGSVSELALPGLKNDRAGVLAGGLAVLSALFKSLKIRRVRPASGALREGVLLDLLGRRAGIDVRDETVLGFASRVGVDEGQAERVQQTALVLLNQCSEAWGLVDKERSKQFLVWAARLHETGIAFAHSRHHRLGAYLVRTADLPGFSRQEQALLAALIELHRRRPKPEVLDTLRGDDRKLARKLAVVLRLAVRTHRNRSVKPEPDLSIRVSKSSVHVQFPDEWFETHPLTVADLKKESRYLLSLGFHLSFDDGGKSA